MPLDCLKSGQWRWWNATKDFKNKKVSFFFSKQSFLFSQTYPVISIVKPSKLKMSTTWFINADLTKFCILIRLEGCFFQSFNLFFVASYLSLGSSCSPALFTICIKTRHCLRQNKLIKKQKVFLLIAKKLFKKNFDQIVINFFCSDWNKIKFFD